MGFGADIRRVEDKDLGNLLQQIMPEDLTKFGLIPEFIGRLPVIGVVDQLDQAALVKILVEPRNALVKQYQKFFELENVELEFTDDALQAIADQAILRATGARGLRAILEEVLLNVMYDLPEPHRRREVRDRRRRRAREGQPHPRAPRRPLPRAPPAPRRQLTLSSAVAITASNVVGYADGEHAMGMEARDVIDIVTCSSRPASPCGSKAAGASMRSSACRTATTATSTWWSTSPVPTTLAALLRSVGFEVIFDDAPGRYSFEDGERPRRRPLLRRRPTATATAGTSTGPTGRGEPDYPSDGFTYGWIGGQQGRRASAPRPRCATTSATRPRRSTSGTRRSCASASTSPCPKPCADRPPPGMGAAGVRR